MIPSKNQKGICAERTNDGNYFCKFSFLLFFRIPVKICKRKLKLLIQFPTEVPEMDDLKNRILVNTIKVFNKKGLKLTMDDVAEQMGISKKTIYKYFNSKEEIFDQIVDYIFDGIKARENEILNEEGLSIDERTRKLLAAFPESFTAIDFAKLGDLKDKYPKIYKKMTRRLESGWEPTIELLEQGRKEGIYREDADLTIFKIMMDASIAKLFEADTLKKTKIKYVECLNQIVDILLQGITA